MLIDTEIAHISNNVTIYRGGAGDIIPTLDWVGINAVVTDPPYGISGGRGRINKARAKGVYNSNFPDTPEYIRDVIVPLVRTMIESCGCVVLTPGNKNFSFYPQPQSFGCFYQPASPGLQVFGNTDAQPVFYYGKNPRKKNMGVKLSWQVTEIPEKNGHPCPKPLKAWTNVVNSVTLSGMTVLDPFMGSGTTGKACLALGLNFIGIESDPVYFEIAKKSLSIASKEQIAKRLFYD